MLNKSIRKLFSEIIKKSQTAPKIAEIRENQLRPLSIFKKLKMKKNYNKAIKILIKFSQNKKMACQILKNTGI